MTTFNQSNQTVTREQRIEQLRQGVFLERGDGSAYFYKGKWHWGDMGYDWGESKVFDSLDELVAYLDDTESDWWESYITIEESDKLYEDWWLSKAVKRSKEQQDGNV